MIINRLLYVCQLNIDIYLLDNRAVMFKNGRMYNSIGKRIRRKRIEAELTQEKLAELTRVSKWTVINWESDKRVPLATSLRDIAFVLKTPAAYFLYGDENDSGDSVINGEANNKDIGFDKLLSIPVYKVNDISARPLTKFAVIAEDNSMEGVGIPLGSKVIVDPCEPVKNMDIALIKYQDMTAFRKVGFMKNGSIQILSADKIRFFIPKEENTPDSFFIYGKACWILSKPRHGA